MPCSIEISKEYRDKYGLPEKMPEADFYAWLANGGLENLALEADINFSFIKIDDTKFKESLNIPKNLKQLITTTVSEINKIKYAALNQGIKFFKQKVDILQNAAYKYLDESNIEASDKIKDAIASLRNEGQLLKLLSLIDEKGDLDAKIARVEKVNKKIKELKKLRKSTKRLTKTNIGFIKDLISDLPSAYEISDLDTYEKLLDNYMAARKGDKATTDVDRELSSFIEGERKYINAYKEQIENLKELIKNAGWVEEYNELEANGAFEGTDIKSQDDWIKLKKAIEENEENEAVQKKLDSVAEKAEEKKKLVENRIQNIRDFISGNEEDLEEAFDAYSSEENPVSLAEIKAIDLEKLSYNDLVLLNNELQNILYSNDFVGVGDFTSKGRLSQKKQSLFDKLASGIKKTLRGLKGLKYEDKRTMLQTITEITNSGSTADAALDFILGSWNGMIGKARTTFNIYKNEYERLKSNLSRDPKKMFDSTVRIETLGFVNQWFKGDSVEEQINHVKQRAARIASQYAKNYEQNKIDKNPTADKKIQIEVNEEGLKALASFGLISDLNFKDGEATYKLVEDITLDILKNKLEPKEQQLYDFIINTYRGLYPEFKKGVNNNLAKDFDEIENYFPTFAISNTVSKDVDKSATPLSLGKDFAPVSKTKANTKDRSRTLAPKNFDYKIDLTSNFEKGLWMTLMTAQGSNEMADMSNMLNSSFGLNRLAEGGLTAEDIQVVKTQLTEKVKGDMLYGASDPKIAGAVSKELGKLLSNTAIGFVLKSWEQVVKQGVSPIATSFIFEPDLTAKIIWNNASGNENFKSAISFLISKTSVQSRLTAFEQSPTNTGVSIEKLRGAEAVKVRATRATIDIQDKYISDVITPVAKLFGLKPKYDSLLEGTDAYVSSVNIAVGYIKSRMKQDSSLTFQGVIDELNAGKVNGQSIQAAERYQADMNAPSNQNDAAKVLRDDPNKVLWFMKSFPLSTSMSFTLAVQKLTSKATKKELTVEEKIDLQNTVWRYVVQQALYRTVNTFLLNWLVGNISDLLLGADDEDDEYEWEKRGLSFGAGIFSDLVLAKYSVIGDIAFAIATNIGFKIWANDKIEKAKEENPDFKSKSLESSLMIESQLGGGMAVVLGVLDRAKSFYEKEYQLAKKSMDEYAALKSVLSVVLREALPFLSGSGTIRSFASKINTAEKKEIKNRMIVYTEIVNKAGFQYNLDKEQMNSVLKDLKGASPSEMKARMVMIEDKGEANLYVVPKNKMKEYRIKAISDLYREDVDDYSVIIKNERFLKSISGIKIEESNKIGEAEKQIKAKINELVKKDINRDVEGIKKYTLK
jgi:hypothetical protein